MYIVWRRKWQPTPVFLPGESHGQRNLAGCSPWGRKSRTRLSDFVLTWLNAVHPTLKSPTCQALEMQGKLKHKPFLHGTCSMNLPATSWWNEIGVLSVHFQTPGPCVSSFQIPPPWPLFFLTISGLWISSSQLESLQQCIPEGLIHSVRSLFTATRQTPGCAFPSMWGPKHQSLLLYPWCNQI